MIAVRQGIDMEPTEPLPFRELDIDTEILEALRDGDDEAMTRLVTKYQDELVGFFYHHCWDQTLAEDLAQTVFVKLYQSRTRYRATARVRTYLYRIAHNAWIDHLRRRRPLVSLDSQDADGFRLVDVLPGPPSAGLPAEDEEEARRQPERIRERVREAVSRLPAGQRDVFVLANQDNMKYQDIARVLGIPEGTVKSRMHAAVRVLRKELADLVE